MIKAEIVAHSINKQGDELINVLCTFPRIILAEVNTHRMLSKNTSSSRAIPFNKMVEAIKTNPFIPIAWQKHHSGMQGNEYWDVTIKGEIGELDHTNIPAKWLRARDTAVTMAEVLHNGPQGVTKQLANRLLEPFMWTTMLITGSKEGWDNFFHLRCPSYETKDGIFKSRKDAIKAAGLTPETCLRESDIDWLLINKGQAEIHMMALAEAIWDAKNESTPKLLNPGEWHIPFEDKIDSIVEQQFNGQTNSAAKVYISTAMGARTSYTIVGEEKEINPENLISLHDRLISQEPPHSSPMEHCSRAMTDTEYSNFVKGNTSEAREGSSIYGWCYNVKGFIPYRYLIDNKLTL